MKRKNIFKSLLAAAMALTMIFGAAPLSGFVGISLPLFSMKAEAATITGTTEDGLFAYVLVGQWTGGSQYRYTATITRCNKDASGEITIPETIGECEVKQIGNHAFSDCTGITSIVIPDSVTEIGSYAFSGCTSLAEITVSPDNQNYSSVDGVLFSKDVSKLITYPKGNKRSKYTVPDGVEKIDENIFFDCTYLEEIAIPDSVTNIGESAFSGCTSLSKVKLSNGLTKIENRNFSGCTSLREIIIPDSVTSIGGSAFSGCTSLREIIIPDSVTSIGGSAFSGCTSLKEVEIPDSVTSIGGSAFSGCTSLKEVEIPDSVTEIDGWAFSGCTSLTKIILPKNMTSIEGGVFSGCSSLESIVIPEGVTTIGTRSQSEPPYGSTFSGCTSLAEIVIPDSVTEIYDFAFSGCTSLSKVKLSNNLTEIAGATFSGCTSLREITIPDSVTSIGNYAFSDCTSLESVTIGSGVEQLDIDAFLDYSNAPVVSASCRRLANITVSPENKTYSSVDGVLFNKDKSELLAYPIGNKRSSYTIPDGVTKIDQKAFYGCRYIETLTIPASVKEIEASALGNCYDIRTINYLGTREQWKEVIIGADNYMFALVNVGCADDTRCDHVWGEWVVVDAATTEKEGLEKRVCSLCSAEETRKIPKLDIVKVTAIELSDSERTATVGTSFTITATVKPDDALNRTIIWSSSDPSIATVDENGTVTAIAEGEAIITAESADGVKAECKVTVEKAKESFGKKLLNVVTAPFRAIINLFKKLFGK